LDSFAGDGLLSAK